MDKYFLKILPKKTRHQSSGYTTLTIQKRGSEAQEAYMCIAMNKEFDDPDRLRHSVHEFYLKTPEEISELYADVPEVIENTQEIVDKCNLEIKLGDPTPPKFKFTKSITKRRA